MAKLRIRPGDGKKMEVDPDDTEDVDEDEDEDETERITKQILAEQELEERLRYSFARKQTSTIL